MYGGDVSGHCKNCGGIVASIENTSTRQHAVNGVGVDEDAAAAVFVEYWCRLIFQPASSVVGRPLDVVIVVGTECIFVCIFMVLGGGGRVSRDNIHHTTRNIPIRRDGCGQSV